MKTQRSTQLFLYCPRGERSVKFVRLALEMEARKEEHRSMVYILVAECTATRHKVKRPGMLSDRIILLHDNARPHTANLVRDTLKRFG